MATKPYPGIYDEEQGSPNLSSLQWMQENFDKTELENTLFVSKVTVTSSGTAGVDAVIPVGSTIVDTIVICTANNGGGTAKVRVGSAGADITNAIAMATLDAVARAASIDTTYSVVGYSGIEVVTNGDADQGFIYILYRK